MYKQALPAWMWSPVSGVICQSGRSLRHFQVGASRLRYRKSKAGASRRLGSVKEAAFTGHDANMRALSRGSGATDTGWVCGKPFASVWRGDDTLVELAPDLSTLDFYAGASSGLFGTATPASSKHVEQVCPGLV